MNKRNMERTINNWVLCPSKSFPGKFYYFNVLTGEAAWSLSEIENTRAMPKNNYMQKVNKWHTYPEPERPPDDRYVPELSWQRKPDQYHFGRPTMPIFGQPVFPVYHPQYMEPHLPYMMQNSTPRGSLFMGDIKAHTDLQNNIWGSDRDLCFSNMNKNNRFVRYEKPRMFNINTSTPIKSQWPYDYQKSSTVPIFGQNFSKISPPVFEPRTNVIKEPIFRRRRTQSDSLMMSSDENLFGTKSSGNLQSFDDSAYFDHTKPSEQTITKFNANSSVFQTGRIFGTKFCENLQTFDNSVPFEKSKANPVVKKNIFMTQPDRNIRVTKQISQGNVSSDNLKSNLRLSPRKRPQSVLGGQEQVHDRREINGEKMDGEKDLLHELSEKDLRYILMAKRKKLGNRQGNKIKTSYVNRDVGTPPKKRVTFDIDFQSDEDDVPDDDHPEVFEDEQACEEAPLDIKALKGLAKPQAKPDAWYIVVDPEVLLKDFEFIETFVQADSKCRLLIPIAVCHELDAITMGDCRGRQHVMSARQLARKISSPPDYITVQAAEECNSDASVSESILHCCLQAIDQKYHVVLITNNATLFKNANLIDIPCFTLQEIKEGASAPKPEISFNIRKITNLNINNDEARKNQCFSVSSSVNPFSLNSKSEIPVNCFKKRLFDDQNIGNTKDEGLFFHNDESNIIYDSCEIPKPNKTTKKFADCENFQSNEVFAPENYRDSVKEPSDTSANTSEIRQIQDSIQNLIIKDVPRNITILKDRSLAIRNNIKEKPKISEDNPKVLRKNDEKTEERKEVVKKMKLQSINGYTIEQHLKKFDVKTKVVEDRVKTRMDEWICSFSQIMEDALTDILQECRGTQRSLAPPWTLAEAVECLRDMYGDRSSVRVIVEKLSALLFSCSCKRGKLILDMNPKDFMTIFGLGIMLIQCLKSVAPPQCELRPTEEALLALLQLVTEPRAEPPTPAPEPAPPLCAGGAAELAERKNFVKKPSEVIEYLKRHYPEWKSYKETTDEAELQQEMDQLKQKGKQLQKIFRTFGKDLHNLNIDSKVISFTITDNSKSSTEKDERFHSNVAQKAQKAKVNNINLDEIETESACDKAIKTTGAKLLRKLTINSLHKMPTLQNIDVEKRDKSGKELMDIIDSMIGKTNKDVTEQEAADVNDGNNNTDQVNKENYAITDNEPKFVRTFGNFTIGNINSQYNDDKNKTTPVNDATKSNDAKYESPKIIRNFNILSSAKEKNDKPNETLDLDALDYDMDYSEDTSRMAIINGENHDDAKAMCDDVEKNDDSPQNDDGNGIEQNHDNIETDTTNDSGFENDSLQAYSLAKTCLTEISETLKRVYSFVSCTAAKFRDGRIDRDAKMALHQKTSKSRKLLADIIVNLKRIVARESIERTSMRAALAKAGVEACNDKRMILYKQVVSKYLEQARLLEEALRAVLTATAPRGAAGGSVSSLSSSIKYINIFE